MKRIDQLKRNQVLATRPTEGRHPYLLECRDSSRDALETAAAYDWALGVIRYLQ